MEIGDDSAHPIEHMGDVPFGEEGRGRYINNVLHVLTIIKNLTSNTKIFEQGMQVWLNCERVSLSLVDEEKAACTQRDWGANLTSSCGTSEWATKTKVNADQRSCVRVSVLKFKESRQVMEGMLAW